MAYEDPHNDLEDAVYALLLSPDPCMRELGWLQADAQGMDVGPLVLMLQRIAQLGQLDYNYRDVRQMLTGIMATNTFRASQAQLTELPKELAYFQHFKVLELDQNRISALPAYLVRYGQLQELSLTQNWLTALPEWIDKLSNLRSLWLKDNFIPMLPNSIGKLQQLETLILSDNVLQQLPNELSRLSQLKRLHLDRNKLKELPDDMGQLQQLKSLSLRGNLGVRLPESLASCQQLNNLDLRDTGWKEEALPDYIRFLRDRGATIQLTVKRSWGKRLWKSWSKLWHY